MNYAIRITLPFNDISGIVWRWAHRSTAIVAYEHPADDEVSKTHVHLALYKCEVRTEALKRMWPEAPGKGNEFWSFKDWNPAFNDNGFMKPDTYIAYMSKGKLSPVFAYEISQDLVEESRQIWVEPVKADKRGDGSEYIIKKVMDKITKTFVVKPYTAEDEYERAESSPEMLLKLVRSETFRQLWGEHRRFPHASHYKIVAGTAYMRLCEHYDCFESGMNIISELWL